jgi:hypothetical protein
VDGFAHKGVGNRESFMDAAVRDYFLERAEAEIDLGNAACHAGAARAHYGRAAFYLDRAHEGAANENSIA